MRRVAVYAGSFDPPTLGHLDVLSRAATLFDVIYVVVAKNSEKQSLFDVSERVELLKRSIPQRKSGAKIVIEVHEGLIVDFCKRVGSHALIRGLRAISDFEAEFKMATMNRRLNRGIETLHIMTDERYLFLSSSLIKEVARHGAKLNGLVPTVVARAIREKMRIQKMKRINK